MDTVKRELLASKLAKALNLSADTVGRYAKAGRIPFEKTPGGHRRFNLGEVRQALMALESSGVEDLRLPVAGDLNPLALGPKVVISSSAKLHESLRATRTVPMSDDNVVAVPVRGTSALRDILENARRIRVS
ncbi:MAG TPA: excisionase family DNA-binding protein [Candidatus Paceibacterota bacterium]|nr:excisionase family DNA-binding protein [Candidatus Paceibacterota bacterium]